MTDKELTDANFELEQDIMKCWNVVDDIRDVVNDFENGHLGQADAVQALRAFADVYANRFDRTFRRYEQVCQGCMSSVTLSRALNLLKQLAQNPAK
jgi:hypothetical protein